MHKFTARDEFKIGDKTCFSVLNQSECNDFKHLIGKTVLVDGIERKVIGVETFAHAAPYRKDEPISLMVANV